MCVLGRPFGIRQMTDLGKNVALMRDMTDTMYNPEKRPMVDHFAGTDLVVEHVETLLVPDHHQHRPRRRQALPLPGRQAGG